MEWSPLLTFEKILLTIQGLLDNNPLSHEPAYETKEHDSQQSIYYSIQSRWLSLNSVLFMMSRNDLPETFQKIIHEYFHSNYELYKKSLSLLEPYDNKTCPTIHGHHVINLSKLKKSFADLFM
jgi:hypothetical protein